LSGKPMSSLQIKGRLGGRGFLDWLAIRVCYKREVHGILVAYLKDEEIDKVTKALNLIHDFDPIRHERLLKDLKLVWVRVLSGSNGQFSPTNLTCELEERFVLNGTTTPQRLASTIVHEATHARLHQWGIGYQENIRARVEKACIRRELAFSKRLPDGKDIAQRASSKLDHLPDLSDAAKAERAVQGRREAMRYLGGPTWLNDIVLSIQQWRWERQRNKTRF
jgi:hypothetical protein